MIRNYNSIISSSIGNILEWYDFGLFTIFSPLFSKIFFPTEDPNMALIITFGIFAIGFFCRPIGALLFGYFGDKIGRAKTLRFSILMISLPTFLIGCMPTYQDIGLFSPFFLTAIRMWQGISIGGEYSGNIIYLAEEAPDYHRGSVTALASSGANTGILLATLIGMLSGSLFSQDMLTLWGWRLPYLISGFFCLFIYATRLKLKETQVFGHLKERKKIVKNPIKTIFTKNRFELARTLGLVCMGTTFYYFCFVYIPIFLQETRAFSISEISLLLSSLIAVMIILAPIAGFICDRVGRRKMLLFNALFVMGVLIPGFLFLQSAYLAETALLMLVFTIASSLEQGTTPIALVENFPMPARYTGLSFGYNLGNGCLGGTVPFICTGLYSYVGPLSPAIYITFCAAITFFVVLFYVPESKERSLLIDHSLVNSLK